RLLKIRDKVKDMPLSAFNVSDFPALYRVSGIGEFAEETSKDLDLLEMRVSEYRALTEKF
ncbi:MAG: hypothetical protein Q7S28_01535, partial [bacterium]|nr:hypothetical protein [bacterium]